MNVAIFVCSSFVFLSLHCGAKDSLGHGLAKPIDSTHSLELLCGDITAQGRGLGWWWHPTVATHKSTHVTQHVTKNKIQRTTRQIDTHGELSLELASSARVASAPVYRRLTSLTPSLMQQHHHTVSRWRCRWVDSQNLPNFAPQNPVKSHFRITVSDKEYSLCQR